LTTDKIVVGRNLIDSTLFVSIQISDSNREQLTCANVAISIHGVLRIQRVAIAMVVETRVFCVLMRYSLGFEPVGLLNLLGIASVGR
jgi:hypothetical protein